MAFDYEAAFKRILSKASILQERYHKILESRDKARDEAEALKLQLEAKEKELQQLRLQVEYLQLASTLAPSRDQIENARAMVTKLVRDIDRCITDLSD